MDVYIPFRASMCFSGQDVEMSRHRAEGTCWPTENAQPAVAASWMCMKIAAPEERVQMPAAVRKRTREGEIPKAARSEKCPLLRRKGTWHCARVRQPLGGWHMGQVDAQGVSESPPRPRGLPPMHACRYLCKVHSQTPGSVGSPPHRSEAKKPVGSRRARVFEPHPKGRGCAGGLGCAYANRRPNVRVIARLPHTLV